MSDPGDEHQDRVVRGPGGSSSIGPPGPTLPRLHVELLRVEAQQVANRAAIDTTRKHLEQLWQRFHALEQERMQLRLAISREGGGRDGRGLTHAPGERRVPMHFNTTNGSWEEL